MESRVNFGRPGKAPRAPAAAGQKFRLALLGDFSGRASRGVLETGKSLASRKPIKVDVDSLDDVIGRMGLSISLTLAENGAVRVPIGSIDDFHPDQLIEDLELFERLAGLRRDLSSKAGFARAAKEVLSWGGHDALPAQPRRSRGSAVPAAKLSDFARLIGRKTAVAEEAPADDLIRRLVGPFVVPQRDSRQDALIARVDEALAAAMRRVLHHPDFQSVEALWRGVEFLVRRIETGARMEIVLYDISAEELAADLAATDALEETGLYGLMVEQPRLDAHQGPLSAVIGLYGFELAPPHAELLGRIAWIAASAGAPFIAGMAPDGLNTPLHDQHPLVRDAFGALWDLPECAYLGLAAPRFMLRMPYGKRTEPIDSFAFEEFTRQGGLSGMLWGHPALIPALLLAEGYLQQGTKLKLGSIMGVGDMAYYVYTDTDGEQIALPCTERLYTERQAVQVSQYRVMPLLSIRGRPEIRLGSFRSLAGAPIAGFWAPVTVAPRSAAAAPEQEMEQPVTPEPEGADAEADEAQPLTAESEEPPTDLDALLSGLNSSAASTEEAAAAPQEPEPAADDLDALLASLNAPAEEVAPDATEPDLDALLASLK